jgi:phosphopantothenoylcysteine synthetase/decarboxylase
MKNILITSGGTQGPIDGVRVITNSSTGATGAALAGAFAHAGFSVTLLRAKNSVAPQENNTITERLFVTVDDLDAACQDLLGGTRFDLVIHAAAVSDFVVESVTTGGERHAAPFLGKIHSSDKLTIDLVPGKKILPMLKTYSASFEIKLVGFKLTDGASEDEIKLAVQKVLASGADLVVQNDKKTMRHTRAVLWDADGPQATLPTLSSLCDALIGYAKKIEKL